MTYIRTDEIKQKQSKTMKEKTKHYDWDNIIEKRKKTIQNNNIKVGRRKGEGRPKTRLEKSCAVCGTIMFVIPSRIEKQKYCSKTCMHSDPIYISKLKNVDRSYMNTEVYALATRDPNRPKYKQYQREVSKLTEQNYAKCIETINPNRYPRTISGVEGGFQLDHKISIRYGFDNNIEPEIIASVENLQMLPWIENVKKGK